MRRPWLTRAVRWEAAADRPGVGSRGQVARRRR
jgi:hypothetical protein